jgi:2'-5' RNA ligase
VTSQLAIIAYPIFEEADLASIQSVRANHDPQFGMLAPHFTLVFPIEAPLSDLAVAVEVATGAIAPFPFTLNSVRAVRDTFGPGGHVFLVPEQGARQVVELHSLLYGGALKWAHRADIPYVPHITVAACRDFVKCETLATELARTQNERCGRIEALAIIEVSEGSVKTLTVSRLAGYGQDHPVE